MGKFLTLIVLIGMFLAVDAIALDGRYSRAAFEEAAYQGQPIRNGIQDWFKGIGL